MDSTLAQILSHLYALTAENQALKQKIAEMSEEKGEPPS